MPSFPDSASTLAQSSMLFPSGPGGAHAYFTPAQSLAILMLPVFAFGLCLWAGSFAVRCGQLVARRRRGRSGAVLAWIAVCSLVACVLIAAICAGANLVFQAVVDDVRRVPPTLLAMSAIGMTCAVRVWRYLNQNRDLFGLRCVTFVFPALIVIASVTLIAVSVLP